MKLLLILVSMLFICSCNNEPQPNTVNSTFWYVDADNCRYQIITIENCDYIINQTHGYSHVLTHKGNCKNPIHY